MIILQKAVQMLNELRIPNEAAGVSKKTCFTFFLVLEITILFTTFYEMAHLLGDKGRVLRTKSKPFGYNRTVSLYCWGKTMLEGGWG
jgi:hypothetical protein